MKPPTGTDFATLFGRPASVRADAPGRVNLIGEHTDYNGGFVLPVAIPQRTRIEAAAREDRVARLWSAQFPEAPITEFNLGAEQRHGDWVDYIKGMTRVLVEFGPVGGFDARVESDVPVGAGLSSSAALEIAAGRVLRELFALPLDDLALAVAGRRAENEFVGAPVGIMDQMAASLGDAEAALWIDTRALTYERVPLPAGAELLVIDSGISHAHAGGEYAVRRQECMAAASQLGVPELRDVPSTELFRVNALPEPLRRRARHVITENQRVLDTVAAMRAGDLECIGALFGASHASMRDDFDITVPAVDRLVALAEGVADVYGARMTGGGFGGAIVALVTRGRARAAGESILARYKNETGHPGRLLLPVG